MEDILKVLRNDIYDFVDLLTVRESSYKKGKEMIGNCFSLKSDNKTKMKKIASFF